MKSKKVEIIFSSSDIGGAERSLGKIIINNTNSLVNYSAATFGKKGELTNWLLNNGIFCQSMDFKYLNLFLYLLRKKPDTVYVIGFRMSVFIRFLKFFFQNTTIIQGVRWNPSTSSLLDISFRYIEKLFGFLIDGYITNSHASKLTLQKVTKRKIAVIYNGIELEYKKPPKYSAREKTIITIANINKRKGLMEYLDCIESILSEDKNLNFIFLGNDNMNGQFQRKIRDRRLQHNVRYLGFKDDVREYIKNSRLFVLPSLYGEGCPTTILESFSLSTPVVAFNIDGIPELISSNIDGFICDLKNYEDLKEKIILLFYEKDLAKRMGEKGFFKVKENFSLDGMIKKHNKFFLGIQ